MLIITKKRARLTGDAVTLLVWLKGAWDVVDEYINKRRKGLDFDCLLVLKIVINYQII